MRLTGAGSPVKNKGFTIIEILVAILILGILMTLFAKMATQYATIVKHQEQKDRALASVRMAIETVTLELEEATSVCVPATDGATAAEVKFERYDPGTSDDPLDSRERLSIRYYIDSGTLYREVTPPSAPKIDYPVAYSIYGFSVRRETSRLYTVIVSVSEAQKQYTVQGKACLRFGI